MAQGEYDSYVGGVYRLLADGATPMAIAEHLCAIETGEMGLGPSKPEFRLPVAERLRGLMFA